MRKTGNDHIEEAGGILTGLEIREAIAAGSIRITPFDVGDPKFLERINPASYDLTLGNQIAVYRNVVNPDFSKGPYAGSRLSTRSGVLDAATPNEIATFTMEPGEPFLLKPGIGYLMHTAERISTDEYVPIIDGKSSIGRLFAAVHITAGFGDAGFDGQYTLEVVVIHPLLVYPGMKFCQMRFHTMIGERESYKKKGNYQGALAEGPVPSRAWKMFEK